MSKNGMPTFAEIYAAYREQDPDKKALMFGILDIKRTGAILRAQNRKSRMNALQAEYRRNEEVQAAHAAWGTQQQRRTEDLQSQLRAGTLSTRNSRSW